MPIASLSVSKSLLGDQFTEKLGGEWFAWFSASLLFGAAIGGIVSGTSATELAEQVAMGVKHSVLFRLRGTRCLCENSGADADSALSCRLGVGGVWPNGMTLVSECWPNASRPLVFRGHECRTKRRHPDAVSACEIQADHAGIMAMDFSTGSGSGNPRFAGHDPAAGITSLAGLAGLTQSSSATDTTSRSKSKCGSVSCSRPTSDA